MDKMAPLTDGGWIKINRNIQESFIWDFAHPQYGLAWVDMLMLANYKDKQIIFNGKLLTIKRGSFITSIVKLSERWHMNRRTVKSFLDVLKSDGMITYECTKQCTTVCIVNYEKYQGFLDFDSASNAQQMHNQMHNDGTTECTTTVQPNAHNIRKKEGKESKEINNKDYIGGAGTPPPPPEPPKQKKSSSPVVISILLNDKTEYQITEADVVAWKDLYQSVDIMQELRKMKGWADANPSKRKTRNGIKRFINNWLSKEQDKYHGPQGGGQFGTASQHSGNKYGTCI